MGGRTGAEWLLRWYRLVHCIGRLSMTKSTCFLVPPCVTSERLLSWVKISESVFSKKLEVREIS